MKRILASILSLAIMINVLPLGSLALVTTGTTSVGVQTAAESRQGDGKRSNEAEFKKNAEDPFLRTDRLSPQQPTAQTETEVANVSVEATNSFGALLMDTMNMEENGYSNRITNVTLEGYTATVKYVTTEEADLVVAVYSDDTEAQMVASGTVRVAASNGNGTVEVELKGEIPEYYTIKAFLLAKSDHAPISAAYTDNMNNKVIVDLDNATVEDFDEERVVNFDDDATTNFAVVNEDVTLMRYDEVESGKNTLTSDEDGSLIYVFSNASTEIKSLQIGDILTYEYAEGELLVVRVSQIEVAGDTVTIYGDDTLKLEDVFDALKIEADPGMGDFTYDGSQADSEVTYLGEVTEEDDLFAENDFNAEFSVFHKFKIGELATSDDKDKDQDGKREDEKVDAKFKVSGEIKIGLKGKLKIYVSGDQNVTEFEITPTTSGSISLSGEVEAKYVLGALGASPIPGLYLCAEPTLKSKATAAIKADFSLTSKIGWKKVGEECKDTSEDPEVKIKASVEGSLYIGIDFAPRVRAVGTLLQIKAIAEVGAEAKVADSRTGEFLQGDSIHACGALKCWKIELAGKVKMGLEASFLGESKVWKTDTLEIALQKKEYHYSIEYKEFGEGECPIKSTS